MAQLLKIRLMALVLVLLGIQAKAHREKTYSLHGYFGDIPVGLEIIDVDGYWSARYFIKSIKQDVFMVGQCDTNICRMVSKTWDREKNEETIIESLEILEDTMYNWHGKWVSPLGDTLPVSLRPIDKDSITHPFDNNQYLNKLAPYSLLKISDIKFKVVKKVRYDNRLKLIWLSDPNSKIAGFRVGGKYPENDQQELNPLLEIDHVQNLLNYYSCGSMAYSGQYVQNISITFVNAHLISYIRQVSSSCQGPVPQQDYYFKTLSVDSARYIQLEDIFWMGEGNKPRYGSQEYFKYRYNVFDKKVLEIFTALYPDKLKTEYCDYTGTKDWHFPEWYLSEEGIHLVNRGFSLPEECKHNREFIIPFDKYKEYIETGLIAK